MDAKMKITKARVSLLLDQPFFGTLTMYLIPVESRDELTISTDGRYLYYNPKWISELTPEELEFVLCHEVLHCAFQHFTREAGRDKVKWNVATDYAVNSILISHGINKMPRGGLYNKKFKGMYAEKIYKLLPEIIKETPLDRHIYGSGGAGDTSPGSSTVVWDEEIQKLWRTAVVSAIQALKERGDIPADIDRFVKDILYPKLKWSEILRRYLDTFEITDYEWLPPDRRFVWQDIIFPGFKEEGLTVVVAIDTSGSIDDFELTEFVTEVTAILNEKIVETYVLSCDAEVHDVQYFPMNSVVTLSDIKVHGGGGTNFIPVFEWVEENGVQPNVLIYLTDGYGLYPYEPPNYPVLWILSEGGKQEIPFGEVIKLEVD